MACASSRLPRRRCGGSTDEQPRRRWRPGICTGVPTPDWCGWRANRQRPSWLKTRCVPARSRHDHRSCAIDLAASPGGTPARRRLAPAAPASAPSRSIYRRTIRPACRSRPISRSEPTTCSTWRATTPSFCSTGATAGPPRGWRRRDSPPIGSRLRLMAAYGRSTASPGASRGSPVCRCAPDRLPRRIPTCSCPCSRIRRRRGCASCGARAYRRDTRRWRSPARRPASSPCWRGARVPMPRCSAATATSWCAASRSKDCASR